MIRFVQYGYSFHAALLLLFLIVCTASNAQQHERAERNAVSVRFEARFENTALVVHDGQQMPQRFIMPTRRTTTDAQSTNAKANDAKAIELPADTLTITALKLYLSHGRLVARTAHKNALPIAHDSETAHLLNVADSSTWRFTMPINTDSTFAPQPLSICFLLGTDSLTNVSGARGGDLDPTKGMYWAWHSGYINIKLEGTSTRCGGFRKKFQFHLGGYMPPLQSAQHLAFEVKSANRYVLTCDVAAFLRGIDLAVTHSVMNPSPESVRFSREFATTFRCEVDGGMQK